MKITYGFLVTRGGASGGRLKETHWRETTAAPAVKLRSGLIGIGASRASASARAMSPRRRIFLSLSWVQVVKHV